ncbi:hypothetical protein M409DRAFT_64331 [Zasmidium cellare ATCC 36951]|uniref:Prenylcysteine lyase domain-containing protein n=1 Tax=Zasmidium cellare ATCC 36951 TaxID=1080233 RepID=A0A6A6CXV5_ZASCE|nr:uncharacterized protein M409DRAFT_64331 [Zasmidium cellare ATCC 36951]KAF2170702.1 hypothetical protein M409DRAFT_64331 [Zasmidium cellare ATCC 36951]
MKLNNIAGAVFALCSLTAACEEQIPLQGSNEAQVKPVNIAIIGAGAAGASTAFHLHRYARSAELPLNITIFERNPYIGGRSTTVSAYNDSSLPVELGASIFVTVNKILVDAVRDFNLSTSTFSSDQDDKYSKIPGDALAVWDGKDIVITQNGKWWDYAKLFWRYGLTPLKTQGLMKKTVGKFLKMYDAPVFPFEDLTKAAHEVELIEVTTRTGEEFMRVNGIEGKFGREIVQASTRVNYAQNLAYIHGLEAMVCMATEGAMSVEGGNWRIFEEMAKRSGAKVLLDTEAGGVWPQGSGSYALNYTHPDGSGSGSGVFDAVVLAAPYQFSELKSLGVDESELTTAKNPDKVLYVELHVTLFTSPHLLSPAFFNLSSDKAAPQVILTTLPPDEEPEKGRKGVGSPGFFSISLLRPITNPSTSVDEYLYKIFSPTPINSTFLSHLLGVQDLPDNNEDTISSRDVTWIYRKVWNSYPYEYPRVTFEDIKLRENLWYTAGMESFISTMETNALMGKNVAKLVVDEWVQRKGISSIEEQSTIWRVFEFLSLRG